MDKRYKEAFTALNERQKQAVTAIDGPLLVLAGPGTGKTQLVSTRVGYILQQTDTPANAILLLTFTEAGVQAMRERLQQLIGRPAYDVQLSTYHAFGGEIFRRYPDELGGAELALIEELGTDSLLRGIIAKLPYSDPLKFADSYINDLKTFISDCKRALLSPDDVEMIAEQNIKFITQVSRDCRQVFDKLTTVSKKTVPAFEELLTALAAVPGAGLPDAVLPLARYVQGELEAALENFKNTNKTTALTEWKRYWLARDEKGGYVLDGRRVNQRLAAAAGIYRKYQNSLKRQRRYDYDDMILRAIDVLEINPDLRYSLADQYSYIMLDEFQDTNPAQFKLVQLLTDHPVHEGRPNVMAVGDDDQAIYAFQGADHANMMVFTRYYRDVKVISLAQNYRSQPEIIEVGQAIARQIQSRLHAQFKGVDKQLVAANKKLPEPAHISLREFKTDAAQYDFVAAEIKRLVDKGTAPGDIAVLAPKHRYLVPLLPYLAEQKLPVHYERRENILDEPLVHQLEQMSRLVLALADSDERLANALWPEILSYDYWRIPTEKIWSISWQSRQTREPWTAIILNDEALSSIATFYLRLAAILPTTTLEQQLDGLVGLPETKDSLGLPLVCPLYDYYFSAKASQGKPVEFNELISNLNILRSRLDSWLLGGNQPNGLRQFIEFIAGHRAAGINILNTSPYFETDDAVNLLTAYGAKGREFRAIFVVAAIDEAWGSASRNQGYRLSLPANLSYIRYQGASEDERLRLLYVAFTRAKTRLYLTSFEQDLAGKSFSRLKYLDIEENEAGQATTAVLPDKFNKVIFDESESLSLRAAANYWTDRHTPPFRPKLRDVLAPRLANYQINQTDLNRFTDIVSYGPAAFFMRCLLYFPAAPAPNEAFGTAIHNSLRSAGRILRSEGRLPGAARLAEIFDAQLSSISLPADELKNLTRRGHASLRAWLKQSGDKLRATDILEYDFRNDGAQIKGARLSGKVDRIAIDQKRQTITVVDYKTGRSYARWAPNVIKLHFFRQQLAFYKLLIENSARYRRYKVETGVIEFVEPNERGRIDRLELVFEQEQELIQRTAALAAAVWQRVQALDLPDISAYPPTLAGIRQFEDDLINQNTGSK